MNYPKVHLTLSYPQQSRQFCDRWIWNWLFNAGSRNVTEARVATVFYFLQHGKDKSTEKFLFWDCLSVREVDL